MDSADLRAADLLANLITVLRQPLPGDEAIAQQAIDLAVQGVTALLIAQNYSSIEVYRSMLSRGYAGLSTFLGNEATAVLLESLASDLRTERTRN